MIEQVVSAPQKSILQSTAPINLFLSGVGSGKTHLLGIKTYQLIRKFPKVRGFVGANTYLQLVQSTLFRIREYWKSIGIVEYDKESHPEGHYVVGKKPPSHFNVEGHNFDDYYGIISFINGCVIFIGSLERAASHEGKEFGWAVLDETKDTDESDVKEIIIARIRQKGMFLVDGELSDKGTPEQQYNPLFIATSPAKVDWINTWFKLEEYLDEITSKIYSKTDFFYKRIDDKFVCISSTWHNVHNVGENYINNILANNTEERGRALIYANPFTLVGGEFYSSFDRLKHVGKCEYDKTKPLHISFDQNSVPYNSCSIWQFERKGEVWYSYCIDEIALQNPRNSTEEVCDEILMRYAHHQSTIYYYGDASGKARSTMNKEFKHHYEIIEFKLRRFLNKTSARMARQNPSVTKRRDFINRIFEEKLPIKIVIDEGCKLMIADMMYVKQDINGAKDKHIVTDKETGDKYQKYGHCSDTCVVGDTLVLTNKGDKRIDEIRVGDLVMTRAGYRPVIAFHNNGIKKVSRYRIGGHELVCTEDHKVFANNRFSMVNSLIDTNILCIFAEKESWNDKQLFTTISNFTVIPMASPPATETTIGDGFMLMANGQSAICIDTFGRKLMAQYRRDLLYTISMVISEITDLKTSLFCHIKNIWAGITKASQMSLSKCSKMFYRIRHSLRQPNGISLRRGENGIGGMQLIFYMAKNILLNARVAALSLRRNYDKCLIGAHENVNSNIRHENTGLKEDITNSEYALSVAEPLKCTNGVRINSVPVHVELSREEGSAEVFDITVDGMHEYFANGILVHNCDYILVEVFNNYYK